MITSSIEWFEIHGTIKGYYQQWKTAKPELGKTYKVVGSGIITEYVEIIAIVDQVAIGKVVRDTNNGSSVGKLSMYYLEGNMMGWKYQEQRSGYRLQEI